LVRLDPTIGDEMQKTRPAVIVSDDGVGDLALKVIAPVTDWKPRYTRVAWMVRLDPIRGSGLTKPSAVDTFQVRSLSRQRFVRQLGRLPDPVMDDVAAALALVLRIDL
jgi:mRNA interferase MazF